MYPTATGERAKLTDAAVAKGKEEIQAITREYEAKDVFNADESGINWRTVPTRSLSVAKSHGGKVNKDRFTFMTCSNATGTEKFPLLVIGTAKNPQLSAAKRVLWK